MALQFYGNVLGDENQILFHMIFKYLRLLCDAFFCDFIFDMQTRKPYTRSQEHKNPAFRIKLFKNDSLINSRWIFLNFPASHGSHGRYNCKIESYNPSFYSGIEIRKKPGTPFIWIGIISMSIGLLLVFTFPFRSLYLALESRNDTVLLTVATIDRKPAEWFYDEAEKIILKWKEGK